MESLLDIEPPSESYSDYLSHCSDSEDEAKPPPAALQPVVEQPLLENTIKSETPSRSKTVSDDNESGGQQGAVGQLKTSPESNIREHPFRRSHSDDNSEDEIEVIEVRPPKKSSNIREHPCRRSHSEEEIEVTEVRPPKKSSNRASRLGANNTDDNGYGSAYEPGDSDTESESELDNQSFARKPSKPARTLLINRASPVASLSSLSGTDSFAYMDRKPPARKKSRQSAPSGVSEGRQRRRSKPSAKKTLFRPTESEILTVDASDSSEEESAPSVMRQLKSTTPPESSSSDQCHTNNQVEESQSNISQKEPARSTESCSGEDEQEPMQSNFDNSSFADQWYGEERERLQSAPDVSIEQQQSSNDASGDENEKERSQSFRRSARARVEIIPGGIIKTQDDDDEEDYVDGDEEDSDDDEDYQEKKPSISKGKAKRGSKKEDEEFFVEKVLDSRIKDDGMVQYLVRWKDYSEKFDTWEPAQSFNGEDILLEAFSKFPRLIHTDSGEEIEDDFVYREKDLERCSVFYDKWLKDNKEDAKEYGFVEAKTTDVHLRIGMWYKLSAGRRLLIARLDWRGGRAKCLTFVPSSLTPFNDTEQQYYFQHAREVDFRRLTKQCKEPVPSSQWCYKNVSDHEFILYSDRFFLPLYSGKKRCIPQSYFYYGIKPKVLVLGAGSVGMSFGYEEEGWDVAWQVEKDRNAADSLRRNYSEFTKANRKLYEESIESFVKNVADERDQYTFRYKDGTKEEVDHIHFSILLRGKSSAEKFADLEAFLECVELFKPKTGMCDSTTDLLLSPGNLEILQNLRDSLRSLEYQMQLMVLDACDYGDPIKTKRVVLWFAEEEMYLPRRPQVTHGEFNENAADEEELDWMEDKPEEEDGLEEKVTVEDMLGWLEDVEPCQLRRSVNVDGEYIYNHCVPQYAPTDAEFAEFALDPNEPAPDITGADHIFHYDKKRLLTIRECMCLKSFDVEYEIHGSLEEQMEIIADAMPLRLARHLCRSVLRSYGFA